jgi:PPK2 family polyphosphate:nucleotide phosphotransferase
MSDLSQGLRAAIVDETFTLSALDPSATPLVDGKSEAKEQLDELRDELFGLHEKLFAERDRAILLVLQGTDASGKNGTIKHVVGAVNPAGLHVASFDEPTQEELEHDFLWRIRKEVPRPGFLGVFNRSHYEDVLVPIAEETADLDEVDQRIKAIGEFERELADSGITIIKCLLHISYDEQRDRFLRRLRRMDKRWKFAESDIDTRRLWDEYQRAYGQIVARTSTDDAPWYAIPADHKWYRNWAIANLLVSELRRMDLDYPEPDLHIEALRKGLEPPG